MNIRDLVIVHWNASTVPFSLPYTQKYISQIFEEILSFAILILLFTEVFFSLRL